MRCLRPARLAIHGLTAVAVVEGLVVTSLVAIGAQGASLSDGVYSDRQASRGGRVYRQACVSCHALNLEGGEMGPGLLGKPFLGPWNGESLGELMALVQETMPQNNPGGLRDQDYVDVLAYLLKANEYPAGDADFTAESLKDIVIESPE